MRKTVRFRWLVTLALILNVLGSPMAWAQVFSAHTQAAVADPMTPACHGGEEAAPAGDPGPVPDALPSCCDGGGCHCAAPAQSICSGADAHSASHPPFSVPFESAAQAARPLDDTLRPPIR